MSDEQLGQILAEVSLCTSAVKHCADEVTTLRQRFDLHERSCTSWRSRILAALSNQGQRIEEHSSRFEMLSETGAEPASEEKPDWDEKTGITRAAESGNVTGLEREARQWRTQARRAEALAQEHAVAAAKERTWLIRALIGIAVLAATGGAGLVARLAGL